MARLRDLIDPEQIRSHTGSLDTDVAEVVADSRAVVPGALFVCTPGYRAEGGEVRADRHEFAAIAAARGAVAFVAERPIDVPPESVVLRVDDAWSVLATAAGRFHGEPSRCLFTVGITGTSGKTSTSYFVDSLLRRAGHRVARIGTIDYRIGAATLVAGQTTPEAPLLQSLLRRAVEDGCTAAVLEVSSHALALRRVGAVDFDVGVFTNIGRDHLNFHVDMDDYRRAKSLLFQSLGAGGKRAVALLNADDSAAAFMRERNRAENLDFAIDAPAAVRAVDIAPTLKGVSFTAVTPRGRRRIELRHLGEYSVANALAAVALGEWLGLELDAIAAAVAETAAVPGRFELVDEGQDFAVAVDYAHKPDALLRLLESARRLRPRRLVTVFGCGGDRDRGKRAVMGRIAAQLSDRTIVTSDNPRGEDPRAIVDEIVAGIREADPALQRCAVEVDRARAIRLAIAEAVAGDMVLIAGKGHETYQLIGGERLDFDDRAHARAALRGRLMRHG